VVGLVNRRLVAAALAAGFVTAFTSTEATQTLGAQEPVSAPISAAHGSNPYWEKQTAPDCVEQSVRVAVDLVKGRSVVSETRIDAYAAKIGIYDPHFGTQQVNWTQLISHYGGRYIPSRATSKATLRRELAAGDRVIAIVNGWSLWDIPGPAGPDHAVVIMNVSVSGQVTLSDGGVPWGNGETVSWGRFSRAWSASGWNGTAVTG
jgi:hypothetical protein